MTSYQLAQSTILSKLYAEPPGVMWTGYAGADAAHAAKIGSLLTALLVPRTLLEENKGAK